MADLLDFAIKLIEICQLLDPLKVQLCMLQDGFLVSPNEILHVGSHDLLVDMQSKSRPLKGLVGDLQVKWIAHRDGTLQRAFGPLLTNILVVSVSIWLGDVN